MMKPQTIFQHEEALQRYLEEKSVFSLKEVQEKFAWRNDLKTTLKEQYAHKISKEPVLPDWLEIGGQMYTMDITQRDGGEIKGTYAHRWVTQDHQQEVYIEFEVQPFQLVVYISGNIAANNKKYFSM